MTDYIAQSEGPPGGWTYIIILFIFFVGTWLILRIMLRRRLLARRTRQDQVSMMEHRFRVKDELDQILVDIQEISREHIAKMDSRISVLNQLLSEADRKIRQIESLLKRIESASTEKLSTVFMNPLHEKVLQYANQGMNVAQICSKTGLERGEVELVLSLHQITQRRP